MNSFKFDFARGDFEVIDGKVTKITEQELIKNKIEKLLRTEYDRYSIYITYGMPFHNWFYGQRDRELIRLAMTRELTERIPAQVEGVLRVYNISFNFERSGVKITFSVDTEYTTYDEVSIWIVF